MSKINFRRQSALKLDTEKRKLEASVINDLKKVFTNLANDAAAIYRGTGTIPSRELAENYAPEILKEIRDSYRKTIRAFGFGLRKSIEKKHSLLFNAERKANLFDFIIGNELNIKQIVEIEDDDLDEKVNQINSQFLLESTLFIANESEAQNEIITDTNTKMITNSIAAGLFAFTAQQSDRQDEINNLESRLVNISDPRQRTSIVRQINRINTEIQESNGNRQEIVAENIRTNLLDKREARSTIIAGVNVGLAEAWSRQKEADLIDDANLITANDQPLSVNKEWVAILDTVTRPSHFNADGQVVNVKDPFNVGGEDLQHPRDPSGSAANILNCRCIAVYEAVVLQ